MFSGTYVFQITKPFVYRDYFCVVYQTLSKIPTTVVFWIGKLRYDSIIYYEWIHRLECLRFFLFQRYEWGTLQTFSHLVFVNSHQNALVRKKCPALIDQIVFISTISSIYLRERSKMNYISKSEINFVRTMMYYQECPKYVIYLLDGWNGPKGRWKYT